MATFDLPGVQEFASHLHEQMKVCDNGEGMECADLDSMLNLYARLCCEFTEKVRQWGREVFSGKVVFDPKVEQILRAEGEQLYARSSEVWMQGRTAEVPCYVLDAQSSLQAALGNLYRLLNRWVTPHPSVGPAARNLISGNGPLVAEMQNQIRALPPLPFDWQPEDSRQKSIYRKLNR